MARVPVREFVWLSAKALPFKAHPSTESHPMERTHMPARSVILMVVVTVSLNVCRSNIACGQQQAPTLSAAERTDSFETKMRLLQDAWQRKDYDLARSLTHSLRDTVVQTQVETENPGTSIIPA